MGRRNDVVLPSVFVSCLDRLKVHEKAMDALFVLQRVLERQSKERRTVIIEHLVTEAMVMDTVFSINKAMNLNLREEVNVLSPVYKRPRDSNSTSPIAKDDAYAKMMQQIMEFVVFVFDQRKKAERTELLNQYIHDFVS